VRTGWAFEKWGSMGSLGSYGRKCDFFGSAFDRLLTLLWDNVWVGVRPGSENLPAASRVGGVSLAGGNSPRAATCLGCQSLGEVSPAANKSGGEESGVSWERRTATVRKHLLLFVLFAVWGIRNLVCAFFVKKWEYGICRSRIYEYSYTVRITYYCISTTVVYMIYNVKVSLFNATLSATL